MFLLFPLPLSPHLLLVSAVISHLHWLTDVHTVEDKTQEEKHRTVVVTLSHRTVVVTLSDTGL